jgi:hypothetical protein
MSVDGVVVEVSSLCAVADETVLELGGEVGHGVSGKRLWEGD